MVRGLNAANSADDSLTIDHGSRVLVRPERHFLSGAATCGEAAREETIPAGTIPFRIVRATQFFEFVGRLADGDTVRLPSTMRRPVAADNVAVTLADVANPPARQRCRRARRADMIGMDELARRVQAAKHDRRVVSPDPHAHYFGTESDHGSVKPGSDVRMGSVRFDDWLAGAGQR